MKLRFHKSIAAALSALLLCLPLFAAEKTEDVNLEDSLQSLNLQEEQRDAAYYFHEHLLEASAVSQASGGQVLEGESRDNGFVFKGAGTGADIAETSDIIQGKSVKVIRMSPERLSTRRLQFQEVPAASRLVLQYKLQQPADSKKNVYLYLQILWGRHVIKKIRIGTRANQWISQTIDLGVVSFLNRSFPVTFELLSDKVEGVQFFFSPKLYS